MRRVVCLLLIAIMLGGVVQAAIRVPRMDAIIALATWIEASIRAGQGCALQWLPCYRDTVTALAHLADDDIFRLSEAAKNGTLTASEVIAAIESAIPSAYYSAGTNIWDKITGVYAMLIKWH